ncbi:hypothetical protein Y032_0135g1899 [Ancylostoma ceylanicum]|uniref:Uncharacterized protein n=1 Tax=Ancylostoma ceylanicum TaxID=53326 RepID=A0A016T5H4_9BILA|nr:hypothetical protein Y032_0135g1899 [Ancylostoma ceylanicum]
MQKEADALMCAMHLAGNDPRHAGRGGPRRRQGHAGGFAAVPGSRGKFWLFASEVELHCNRPTRSEMYRPSGTTSPPKRLRRPRLLAHHVVISNLRIAFDRCLSDINQ